MPQEPYQRCSQAIFEAWLKPKLEANPLVETHFGWKFESLVESDTHVECKLTDQTGKQHIVRSQYVIGCDGAGSKVREAIGSKMEGGPVPQAMHLIHFKSRDLTRLHKQGQFWHIFFTSGAIIIAQDEVDTWTIHRPVPVDTDVSGIDPRETIYQALGGECAPFEIEIDDILITNVWRPTMALADKYASVGKRVFISGDAAHQNIPTGGYGMNTAVGDSFDIGWKLAAVLTGHGGPQLLASYETERRPVGARNVEHCGMHFLVHAKFLGWCSESPQLATAATSEGQALRDKVAEHVRNHNGENTDHGIELGYRYNGSPVIIGDSNVEEPVWEAGRYVPSTWPGARAPSVFLKTQPQTSIFDLFGTGAEFTLVDLSVAGEYAKAFAAAAARAEPKLPLKTLHLPNEPHLRRVWERDAVLVRPDDHVAWRAPEEQAAVVDADAVLATAAGW
ncbi:hypothetical protein DM02DRAFT_149202 [Periconia macrospinosa]|uniref:FAD-binding domain-containing protein n=1 Tax=Periconia macrospinosa TaxID=97972 RepID=A0A2V1DBF6_9PLEO|nr:hypothetical protein DM02DRAFT_149202 [Periconia macrospinosa]